MKKKLLFSMLLIPFLVVGCKPASSTGDDDDDYHYTPQDISARDVSYPTEIPVMSERSIQIHYHRDNNKYSEWGLWIWDPAAADDNEVDTFNYQDDFGVIAYYPTSKFGDCSDGTLGYIIRKLSGWTKDPDLNRYFDFNTMIPDDNNCYHVYLYSGDKNAYSSPNKTFQDSILSCAFVDEYSIRIETTNKFVDYTLYKNDQIIKVGEGVNQKAVTFSLPSSDSTIDYESIYKVDVKFKSSGKTLSKVVSVANLYNSSGFNDAYKYDGDLGAIYTSSSTTFRVWSPISSSIKVRVYDNGTPVSVDSTKGSDEFVEYTMEKGEKGTFQKVVNGDLDGKYYTYVVTNSMFKDKEIVDPYAKSAGVSGLRGMVVDFSKTNPDGWNEVAPHQYNRNELTVWETHVADVTSHDSWVGKNSSANKRKYLGLVESGTSYTNTSSGVEVTTGFDHIKELGVNAVQLIPIFDQANDETSYTFNWGYNPLNYNVLEGMYSSDPYDGYARIREFKQVVKEFNKVGINVIMDVVYNHVNGADGSNFDVLMPGYYYRYNSDGSLSNGSGCGNETASEMPMMRKFMVDSTKFWASEYKLGGFRFDLMGLHDITTMNKLAAECKKINPTICIYGEPWTGGTSAMPGFDQNAAKQSNTSKFVGYGQFNDQMRDALIKGGMNSTDSKGWITNTSSVSSNDVNAIKDGIKGATTNAADDPNKTVNYVSCHDNYTLYDRVRLAAKGEDNETYYAMSVLANAIVFSSQGTSFMLAGEEMGRTKGGDGNSYQSGDKVNALDYNRKTKHMNVFGNYKNLIKFKQEATGLHAETCQLNVETLDGGAVLKYKVMDGTTEYMVIHHNGVNATSSIDLSAYDVYFDTLGTLTAGTALPNNFVPAQFQTLIAVKR